MGLFGKKKAAPVSAHGRDELTGLLTLDKFYGDAAECLRYYSGACFALCRTSIGNLADINETFGRESGDKLILEATRVLAEGEGGHTLNSYDQANFVTLMRYETVEELDSHIDAMHERLSNIGSVLPGNPKVYMHTGVYTTDGRLIDMTVKEMAECAGIAESEASKRTHASIVRYTDQLREEAALDAELEKDMRTALKKKQFDVCLQPRFNMQTGEVEGAKIMSRWIHPKHGVIGSYRYVPMFVKNGFILDLDIYLFEQACIILKRWYDKGLFAVPLSLNVPRALLASRRSMETYVQLKNKYTIPDGMCDIEFSERLVDDNRTTIGTVFEYFRSNGFKCSIENFGSGTRSLSTITDLPINSVKFSRDYFVDGLPTEEQGKEIFNAIETAKGAGVTTAATGVPDAAVPYLKRLGCDIIQGGEDIEPLSPADFEKKYLNEQ